MSIFQKILIKDLRRNKSLNITLFLFVIAAALISAVSVSVIYCTLAGVNNTFTVANIAEHNIFLESREKDRDKIDAAISKWAQKVEYVKSYSKERFVEIESKALKFPIKGVSDHSKFSEAVFLVGKMPQIHNLVFDENDRPFYVKGGDIAVSTAFKKMTGVQIGDKIQLTIDTENTYEYTVSHFFKDTFFPMDYSVNYRYFLSDDDFEQITRKATNHIEAYSFSCKDKENFLYDFSEQKFSEFFNCISNFDIKAVYNVNKMISVILLMVSIFLVIIVFVTIRFTIISSIQEDFKEIGMMKAIGIEPLYIKGLYLLKYAIISVIGSAIGYTVSFPVSKYFLEETFKNILIPSGLVKNLITLSAGAIVVVLITMFCVFSMVGMDKLSVIDAIRSGSNGDHFGKGSKFFLHKRRRMGVPFYLAVSGILDGFRRYIFLICAFVFGTALLLFPVIILNSLASTEFLSNHHMLPSDFWIVNTQEKYNEYVHSLAKGYKPDNEGFINWLEEKFESCCGYDITFGKVKSEEYNYIESDNIKISLLAFFGENNTGQYCYSAGIAPVLENEIAVSNWMSDVYNIKLGSILKLKVNCYNDEKTAIIPVEKEFFVTGLYQCMEYSGRSIIMGNEYGKNVPGEILLSRITINAPEIEKAGIVKKLQEKFGKEIVKSIKEYVKYDLDVYISMLTSMIIFVFAIVCLVWFLMITLYMKIIIAKEIHDIALVKSLGMNNNQVCFWQIGRILIMLLVSMVIGIILSIIMVGMGDNYILKLINVGITDMKLIIDRIAVFILCPVIIFTVAFIAALISCLDIRKGNIWNVNKE